jgi:chaperonin GroEL
MRGEVKDVHIGEVREKVLVGARKVYDAVASAYGPVSGNVALEKNYGSIVISHDGVSVAREVVLKDKLEDIGADLLIQASSKSNDTAGDGTTASVLLGYHIMRLAHQRIVAGANPMLLRKGIDKASIWLKEQIEALAVPVPDDKLHEVATISASDEEVGKLVANTIIKVGGVGITVEEYDGLGVIQEVVEGLYFEKGWAMPHFVTDRETEEAVHDHVNILITEKRISTNQDIIPLLELIGTQAEHKTVLIIANVNNKALETCALTNLKGGIKVCVVPPPVYGDQVLPFLEDVAVLTGGKLIPASLPADKVTLDYLGYAEKVIVSQSNTTILQGQGVKEDIDGRIDTLKRQLKDPKYTAFQRERMEKRLSKLQGKLGIIKVGGATETSRREMKFRVDDAVCATRAAKEGGIVPGGATTLVQIARHATNVPAMTEDEQAGFGVVLTALYEPFKQLMANAGEDPGYRLMQLNGREVGKGFNVKDMTDDPIDLMEAGIIDPANVLKSVVENACEVAGIAITLNAAITIDRDWQLQQVQLNKVA